MRAEHGAVANQLEGGKGGCATVLGLGGWILLDLGRIEAEKEEKEIRQK
jgi:hypothetical protein